MHVLLRCAGGATTGMAMGVAESSLITFDLLFDPDRCYLLNRLAVCFNRLPQQILTKKIRSKGAGCLLLTATLFVCRSRLIICLARRTIYLWLVHKPFFFRKKRYVVRWFTCVRWGDGIDWRIVWNGKLRLFFAAGSERFASSIYICGNDLVKQ